MPLTSKSVLASCHHLDTCPIIFSSLSRLQHYGIAFVRFLQIENVAQLPRTGLLVVERRRCTLSLVNASFYLTHFSDRCRLTKKRSLFARFCIRMLSPDRSEGRAQWHRPAPTGTHKALKAAESRRVKSRRWKTIQRP